mgnify:CR=1 FL=1
MTTFTGPRETHRPAPDTLFNQIADYVLAFEPDSAAARQTAYYCLLDTLGCGVLALNYPACTKLLGPVVPGATLPGGARVPGTNFELEPVIAAFNIGTMIRWLDFNFNPNRLWPDAELKGFEFLYGRPGLKPHW